MKSFTQFLTELSPEVLKRYKEKAEKSKAQHAAAADAADARGDYDAGSKHTDKEFNRGVGIGRAKIRLKRKSIRENQSHRDRVEREIENLKKQYSSQKTPTGVGQKAVHKINSRDHNDYAEFAKKGAKIHPHAAKEYVAAEKAHREASKAHQNAHDDFNHHSQRAAWDATKRANDASKAAEKARWDKKT